MSVTRVEEHLLAMEKTSPFAWTLNNIPLPKNMKWDFKFRKWQIPILNDKNKNITVIKPAQVGMSTVFGAKLLYYAYHIPMRAAYVLPRQKDYQDLVKSRINPMINDSELLSSIVGRNDSIALKVLGKSFLHFLEANTEPRMLDIDALIIDETNLCNQENLDLYSARLYASLYKIHHNLSTPTLPNVGVDRLIKQTTWNIWHVQCPYCKFWIPFDEDWLKVLRESKHRIYYGYNCCDMCNDVGLNPHHIANGTWVPKYPEIPQVGYQVVRTMDALTTAEDLWKLWKNTRLEKHFYNSGLGLPYVADSVSLDKETILKTCVSTEVVKEDYARKDSKYFIGIDQGNVLHMTVLKESKDGVLDLVFAGEFDDSGGENPFRKALRHITRYKNPTVVVDSAPNTHSAKELINSLSRHSSFLANYQSLPPQQDSFFVDSKNNESMVLINKHEALDELFNNFIKTYKLRFYSRDGRIDDVIETVATHISALKRTYQTRKTIGKGEEVIAVWEPTSPDHYAMALVYSLTGYYKSKLSKKPRLRWSML